MTCPLVTKPLHRTVWVVSWVYWNGPDQGGGGFWWFYQRDNADQFFDKEREAWAGEVARVRLVSVDVPDNLFGQDMGLNQVITDWIDADIDQVEDFHRNPAVRVALIGVGQ